MTEACRSLDRSALLADALEDFLVHLRRAIVE